MMTEYQRGINDGLDVCYLVINLFKKYGVSGRQHEKCFSLNDIGNFMSQEIDVAKVNDEGYLEQKVINYLHKNYILRVIFYRKVNHSFEEQQQK
jgi:hypothetical protein